MKDSTIGAIRVATLLALLPVCTVQAQPAQTLADVRLYTEPGDTLRVRHSDGRLTMGDLRSVSADGLLLDVDGQLVTIPVTEMREVGTTSDSLRNGALVGLGTGAAIGMLLSISSGTSGDGLVDAATAGPAALIGVVGGAAAGVGIGIGIDALVRRYRVLYQAPVQLAPITVAGGYGMAFRLSW